MQAFAGNVHVDGAVVNAGSHTLTPELRLAKLAANAKVLDSACIHRAGFYRQALKAEQLMLKNSLLNDIDQLYERVSTGGAFSAWLNNLKELIVAQQPSGRFLPIKLGVNSLELDASSNWLLQADDELFYPVCTSKVFVLSPRAAWVQMDYKAMQALATYAADIPNAHFYQQGYVFIVHANGFVSQQKIGYWSPSNTYYLDSGALLFRPLKASLVNAVNKRFNEDLAHWFSLLKPVL